MITVWPRWQETPIIVNLRLVRILLIIHTQIYDRRGSPEANAELLMGNLGHHWWCGRCMLDGPMNYKAFRRSWLRRKNMRWVGCQVSVKAYRIITGHLKNVSSESFLTCPPRKMNSGFRNKYIWRCLLTWQTFQTMWYYCTVPRIRWRQRVFQWAVRSAICGTPLTHACLRVGGCTWRRMPPQAWGAPGTFLRLVLTRGYRSPPRTRFLRAYLYYNVHAEYIGRWAIR